MEGTLEKLVEKYPDLADCLPDIEAAYDAIVNCYEHGGKLLICGNGGSAADSEHIVGELMKGFLKKRPVLPETRAALADAYPENGGYLADHLQRALPAISLLSQSGLISAFANDVAADMVFAQQVQGYGQAGDVLIGLSTSGNSKNVIHALQVGNVLGLHTIGLTGQDGGKMTALCDTTIRPPWRDTLDIQERHLAIYHALCVMVEGAFFQE